LWVYFLRTNVIKLSKKKRVSTHSIVERKERKKGIVVVVVAVVVVVVVENKLCLLSRCECRRQSVLLTLVGAKKGATTFGITTLAILTLCMMG